ncbi:MAG TPA: hypothetical protein VNJ53_11565 [Gaiellaceae bacterium]|nr:hypothetical protein [Gaiellaceae bacterium]
MGLADELERVAGLATAHLEPGDAVAGVLAAEAAPGERVYLCAVNGADGFRSWLALRADGEPVTSRVVLREAVSIAALCEVAVDAVGGGDVEGLLVRLREARERDGAQTEAAEQAALVLREVVGEPPQLATPERLDAIGTAVRRLERELDASAASPFAAALRAAQTAVAELQREVEAGYRLPLA